MIMLTRSSERIFNESRNTGLNHIDNGWRYDFGVTSQVKYLLDLWNSMMHLEKSRKKIML